MTDNPRRQRKPGQRIDKVAVACHATLAVLLFLGGLTLRLRFSRYPEVWPGLQPAADSLMIAAPLVAARIFVPAWKGNGLWWLVAIVAAALGLLYVLVMTSWLGRHAENAQALLAPALTFLVLVVGLTPRARS